MRPVAVRSFERVPQSTVAALAEFGVSTVHESLNRGGLLKPYMRPIWPGARIAGNAVTALAHPGDNTMLHVAVELCQPGDVLVVAVSADNTDGMFGELLATCAKSRGVSALVIDAGCRDVRELTEMQFPVWSRAVSAKGTIKATLGSVNVPIVCAGAAVSAGDVIVADDDGVVVVPHRLAGSVVEAGRQRLLKEQANRSRYAAGELGLDVNGMRPWLQKMGLIYVDRIDDLDRQQGGQGRGQEGADDR